MNARPPARPMPERPLSRDLARFIHTLRYEDIPADVVAMARRCLLDALGIALPAHATEQARLLISNIVTWGGSPEATIIGTERRVPRPQAGLAGGLLCHSFDFDDTHLPSIVHPSACIVPAALSAVDSSDCTGRDLVVLAVIGYEVMTRIGRAAPGQFQVRGLHATSVCGTIAAAAVGARAYGADERGIENSIGCAASLASGILEPAHDGTWSKLLQAGWAVHAGLTAATLGTAGFLAPQRALEGEFGLYRAMVDDDFDASRAVEALGDRWETRDISTKLYPVCHHLHAFLDACRSLVDEERLRTDDIEHVALVVGEQQSRIVCEPWEAKIAPASGYAARFSLPHAVAATLAHGEVSLDHYSDCGLGNPATLAMVRRISYRTEPNPNFPRTLAGDVTVTTRDGRRLHRRAPNCRGTPDGGPITDEDVRRKFLRNAEPVIGPARAHRVMALVDDLERVPVRQLLAALTIDVPG